MLGGCSSGSDSAFEVEHHHSLPMVETATLFGANGGHVDMFSAKLDSIDCTLQNRHVS